MKCRIEEFEFRVGETFHLELIYVDADHTTPGKASEHSDIVRGRFLELVPYKRIVQMVEFDSKDSAFTGESTLTTLAAFAEAKS
jgi:uncharacterized protein YndB with AHSA1/START domain